MEEKAAYDQLRFYKEAECLFLIPTFEAGKYPRPCMSIKAFGSGSLIHIILYNSYDSFLFTFLCCGPSS